MALDNAEENEMKWGRAEGSRNISSRVEDAFEGSTTLQTFPQPMSGGGFFTSNQTVGGGVLFGFLFCKREGGRGLTATKKNM